jgi:Na+/proline symporter
MDRSSQYLFLLIMSLFTRSVYLQTRREEAEKNRSLDVLRAAVVCVLGHVDTGENQ